MAKKLMALVMVISVLGAFVAGCSGGSSDAEKPAADKTAEKPAETK